MSTIVQLIQEGSQGFLEGAVADPGKRKGGFQTNQRAVQVVKIVHARELFGGMSSGINFEKYDDIPVEATGESPPKPIYEFSDCKLSEVITENIKVCQYIACTFFYLSIQFLVYM